MKNITLFTGSKMPAAITEHLTEALDEFLDGSGGVSNIEVLIGCLEFIKHITDQVETRWPDDVIGFRETVVLNLAKLLNVSAESAGVKV